MTQHGFTVWARIASSGKCRDCKQLIVWRLNRKTGKHLPFNGVLEPLHAFVEEATQLPMEVLSKDDLHMVTCTKRKTAAAAGARA